MSKVLISFDTTGSMSPCIHEVRQQINAVTARLFSTIPDLQIGIISHGDYCDGKNMINWIEFTNDRVALEQFIRTAPNTDGGDGDECYEFILRHAASMVNWGDDPTKIMIMIGDANPHEPGYNKFGWRVTEKWQDIASELGDKKIKIYAIQALGRESSRFFWESLAYMTNGRKADLAQFADSVEGLVASILHATSPDAYTAFTSSIKVNRTLANMLAGLETAPVKPSAEYHTYHYEPRTYSTRPSRFSFVVPDGLTPVPPERFQIVTVDGEWRINDFVAHIGAAYTAGRGFYEFTKSEKIQPKKEVILRDKESGDMFTGKEAREAIGLPYGTEGRVSPRCSDKYQVFVQSTSYTRKLVKGTKFLYEAA